MLESILAEFSATRLAELVAVALAIAYLILAIRQNIWCWAAAFFSTGIYVFLYFEVALRMESALNVFYMAVAVYGFWQWRGGARNIALPVTRYRWSRHLIAIVVILMLSALSGSLLQEFTIASFPYLDSLTTWASVWATILVARKELYNWFYWAAIDSVSIFLYLNKGLGLTACLFVFYLFLIPIGYRSWRAELKDVND
ncbi:MAG: nicotinamide riboside transporter PnuC [Pseudomonadota bacterium]